jgi:hypothetical protein
MIFNKIMCRQGAGGAQVDKIVLPSLTLRSFCWSVGDVYDVAISRVVLLPATRLLVKH